MLVQQNDTGLRSQRRRVESNIRRVRNTFPIYNFDWLKGVHIPRHWENCWCNCLNNRIVIFKNQVLTPEFFRVRARRTIVLHIWRFCHFHFVARIVSWHGLGHVHIPHHSHDRETHQVGEFRGDKRECENFIHLLVAL